MRKDSKKERSWDDNLRSEAIKNNTLIGVGIGLATVGVIAHGFSLSVAVTSDQENTATPDTTTIESSYSGPTSKNQSEFSLAAQSEDAKKVQVYGIEGPDGDFTSTVAIPTAE